MSTRTHKTHTEACKHYSAFRLLGIGMGVWALSVAGCGLSFNWGSLFACRVLVGVGEASFVALATPFIGEQLALRHAGLRALLGLPRALQQPACLALGLP